MALSDRDRAILDVERSWWTESSSKEAVIRRRLDLSPSRYRQLLAVLVENPAAMAYDPLVVRRVRRELVRRRQARLEGRPAGEPPVR